VVKKIPRQALAFGCLRSNNEEFETQPIKLNMKMTYSNTWTYEVTAE